MRRTICLIGVALAAIALPAATASSANGGANLPFKGTLTGSGTLNLATFQLHAVVTGELTHFGRATLEENIQVTPQLDGTLIWDGPWTLTAANGDSVSGSSEGVGHFTDPTQSTSLWSVTFRSTQGTGRFAQAHLTFHADAIATTTGLAGGILSADVLAPLDGVLSR